MQPADMRYVHLSFRHRHMLPLDLITPPSALLLQIRERKLMLQELAANPPQPLEWQDMHFA